MKVRITRLYFDGLKRHRPGTVLNISDKKYKKLDEIPKTSKKKVGDYIYFADSCMEIVSDSTPAVEVSRPIPGLTVDTNQVGVLNSSGPILVEDDGVVPSNETVI